MKSILPLLFVFTLIFSCNTKEKQLSEESWLIKEGFYKNNKIDFVSTDLIQFADPYGNPILDLKFEKNGNISLPGIHCQDIQARWEILNNQLIFIVDSIRYKSFYNIDLDKETLESLTDDNSAVEINEDTTKELDGPKLSLIRKNDSPDDFYNAVKIYADTFEINIDGDFLTLKSKNTLIEAVKDRTIVELIDSYLK